MANKIPWYETWDWKSLVGIVFVIFTIAGLMVFKFLPQFVRNDRISNYEGQSIGYIKLVKENTRIKQGHDGNKLVIDSYTVNYSYTIDSVTFESEDLIVGTPINALFLDKISQSDFKEPVIIMYDLTNHEKSLIKLNN